MRPDKHVHVAKIGQGIDWSGTTSDIMVCGNNTVYKVYKTAGNKESVLGQAQQRRGALEEHYQREGGRQGDWEKAWCGRQRARQLQGLEQGHLEQNGHPSGHPSLKFFTSDRAHNGGSDRWGQTRYSL